MENGSILIVEDEAIIAAELKRSLSILGYRVQGPAHNVEQALRSAADSPPDVVLMDVALPGQSDGIELAQRLRESHDTRVVYLTALSDEETIRRAGDTEPAAYLTKPVDPTELHAALQVALLSRMRKRDQEASIRALEAERARLNSILDQLPLGVIIASAPHGEVVLCNQEARRMVCSELPQMPAYADWRQQGDSADWPLLRAIRDGATIKEREIEYDAKENTRTFEVSAGPIMGVDGIEAGVLALHDVTSRKDLEFERQRMATELERSNAELARFAHAASHDIKEPLRSISAFAELVDRRLGDQADPVVRSYVDFIRNGAERLSVLISDMITFAQVGGKFEVTKVQAHQAVAAARENLRKSIQENHAEIAICKLPVVCANEHQLTRLFQNLMENAIRFRADKNPRIEIAAQPKGSFWEFVVRDNGIGIDEKHHRDVFLPLHRLDTQRSGSGLGLATCKAIVERHGGTIWLESEPGAGSSFYFTLPGVPNA